MSHFVIYWMTDTKKTRNACTVICKVSSISNDVPLTPVPPVTNLGLSFTSDVITFDQNWHHLYSASAGGKDLSNDAQIRVMGRMEPQICKISCHYSLLLHV